MELQWFALYTKPRHEKKVFNSLLEKGINAYCPLTLTLKKWSDRLKKVEEPLFKSYVFVQIEPSGHAFIRTIPGVVNFVYWLGKPAVIRPAEIDTIRRFLMEFPEASLEPLKGIKPGDRLLFNAGVLMGKEAVAISVKKNQIKVRLENLGYNLVATVDASHLIKKDQNI